MPSSGPSGDSERKVGDSATALVEKNAARPFGSIPLSAGAHIFFDLANEKSDLVSDADGRSEFSSMCSLVNGSTMGNLKPAAGLHRHLATPP